MTVTTITQASFTDGVYAISKPGDYELGEDVTGKIAIDKKSGGTFAINLKGHTLANANGGNAIYCEGSGRSATLTISNGSVVATGKSVQAVRIDAHFTEVNLNGVSVDTTDGICVHVQTAKTVYINGGSYKTTNKTDGVDEPVFCVVNGTLNVNGGDSAATITLNGGTNIVKKDETGSGSIVLSGGTFSAFPTQATLSDSSAYSVHKTSKGFEVVSGKGAPESACWKVVKKGFGTIYFDTTADKEAFAKGYATEDDQFTQLRATVTFDPANGEESVTKTVEVGSMVSAPEVPAKKDGVFKFWSVDGKTAFNFSTAINSDITLTAVYDDAVATNGHEGYASLQAAINDYAPGDDDVITLLKDTTESVVVSSIEGEDKAIKIDLGGKTLTAKTGESAIKLSGVRTLTLTNGSVTSADKPCLEVTADAAGSTVNLASQGEFSSGKLELSATCKNEPKVSAVYVVGNPEAQTELHVMGGTYSSEGSNALRVTNNVCVHVTDGDFSSGETDGAASTIMAFINCKVEFAGGSVNHHITLANDSTANIYSGSFGDATNANQVVEGKYLYKAKGEEFDYEVRDREDALDDASFVVYGDGVKRVYFADFDEAEDYNVTLEDRGVKNSAVINLYRAAFIVMGEQYDLRVYECGDEIGELPEAPEVEDYTFAGWYVNGQKIDSSYSVIGDVEVTAMWYWNGSSDEKPTDNPKAKGNKHLPQTGDPALAVSGIAAAGAALAGLGAIRRRK